MPEDKSKEDNNEAQSPEPDISESTPPAESPEAKKKSPMVWVTRIVLLLSLIVFIWYLLADRRTPYTNQVRVTELIIPITPRVSGYLTDVRVKLNSVVSLGDTLFQLDPIPFELAIHKARANVDMATQQMGAKGANVQAAASSVGVAKAQLDRAQRSYDRTQRILEKNPGAVSQADIDRVETSLNQAKEKLASSEANLVKAQEDLGDTGPNNSQLRLAVAELENAQLQLSYTTVYAPNDGVIESFNVDEGYYGQAGQPLATLVSKQDIWLQADYRENNLSNMKAGDPVKFILDVAPGRIFEGYVRGIGSGVDAGNPVNRGGLPTVGSTSSWLREPQRFPVTIAFDDEEALELCRAGAQADVMVYTGKHGLLNSIANFRIRLKSWLSYVN
jgi:multidrug resistance efflux pump